MQLVLVGCPHGRRPGDVAAVSSRTLPGAETPAEAFEALRRASQEGDAASLFALVTPETRRELLAAALLGATFATLGPDLAPVPALEEELKQLLARHHVSAAPAAEVAPPPVEAGQTDTPPQPAPEPPRGAEALEGRLGAVVDRADLFAELIAFAERTGRPLLTRYGELNELKVRRRRATGRATGVGPDGQPVDEPLELRRIDGRWFVHLSPGGGPAEGDGERDGGEGAQRR